MWHVLIFDFVADVADVTYLLLINISEFHFWTLCGLILPIAQCISDLASLWVFSNFVTFKPQRHSSHKMPMLGLQRREKRHEKLSFLMSTQRYFHNFFLEFLNNVFYIFIIVLLIPKPIEGNINANKTPHTKLQHDKIGLTGCNHQIPLGSK